MTLQINPGMAMFSLGGSVISSLFSAYTSYATQGYKNSIIKSQESIAQSNANIVATNANIARYNAQISNIKADLARLNASVLDMKADSTFISGEKSIANMTMAAGKVKAKQKASLAANGIAVGEGSAAELQASTDITKEIDKNTMETNMVSNAWGFKTKATEMRNVALGYEGEAYAYNKQGYGMDLQSQAMAKYGAAIGSQTQSAFGAFGSTLLSGVSQVANKYMLYDALGVFSSGTQSLAPIEDKTVLFQGWNYR